MSISKIYKKIRYSMVHNPYAPYLTNEECHGLEIFNSRGGDRASVQISNGDVIIKINRIDLGDIISKIYLKKSANNSWDVCANSSQPEFRQIDKLFTWHNSDLITALQAINSISTTKLEKQYFIPHLAANIIDTLNITADEIDNRFAIFKDLNDGAKITIGFIQETAVMNNQIISHTNLYYHSLNREIMTFYHGERNKLTRKIGFVIHTKESPEIYTEIKNMGLSLEAIGMRHIIFTNLRKKTLDLPNNNDNIIGNGNNLDIIVYRIYKSKYNKDEINF